MTADLDQWPEDLRAAEAARRRAMYDADAQALDRLLHDDLVYIHSIGLRDDKRSHIRDIGTGVLRYVGLRTSDVASVVLGNDVWLLTGKLRGEVVAGGQTFPIDVSFTCVWQRDRDWRLVSWQSTASPAGG